MQVADGFKLRGLDKLIVEDNVYFQKFFVKGENNLTFEIFNDSLNPYFSEKGTNQRTKEMNLFESFLDAVERISNEGN